MSQSTSGEEAFRRIIDALHDRGSAMKSGTGRSVMATCPAHEDRTPSLHVTPTETRALIYCHAGCDTRDVVSALGLEMPDLYGGRDQVEYRYPDRVVTRLTAAKEFRQRVSPSANGHTRLYRSAPITAGATVYLVEGEEDVHAVAAAGGIGTTAPQGASNFHLADVAPLAGAHVIAVVDRDEGGDRWAGIVMEKVAPIAASLRLVQARTGKDFSAHLAAGGGLEDLQPYGPPRPWQPEDLSDVLDGSYRPPEPSVGRRTDGQRLFYPGETHTVVSETEGGKTWLALAVAATEMRAGNSVVYIDFESDRGTVAGRLLTMGVNSDLIRQQFDYIHPDVPLAGEHELDLAQVLSASPTLVVLDGVTEAMVMHGFNPNDNFDVSKFGRQVIDRLTATGAAVVSLDHVVKDPTGRGRYALGGVHKANRVTGAQYLLYAKDPFGVDMRGRSELRVGKDRPGQLRKHGTPSGRDGDSTVGFGYLIVDSTQGGDQFAEVTIEPPKERNEDFRPTVLMERVAETLAQHPQGLAKRVIRSIRGGSDKLDMALDFLILDGYVTAKTPHVLIQPYPRDTP